MTTLERNIGVCLRFIAACTEEGRCAAAEEAREILSGCDECDRSHSIPEKAEDLLTFVGVPCHLSGYNYLACAIGIVVDKPSIMFKSVTKELYPKVAEAFGSTTQKVERAVRHAVEYSFNNADWDELKKIFGGTISKDLGKVTNAQFIATLAKEVRRQVYGG